MISDTVLVSGAHFHSELQPSHIMRQYQCLLVSCLLAVSLQNPISQDDKPEGRASTAGLIALDSSIILPLLLAGAAFAKVTIKDYVLSLQKHH